MHESNIEEIGSLGECQFSRKTAYFQNISMRKIDC